MKKSNIISRLKKEADTRVVERHTKHLSKDVIRVHQKSQRILKRIRDGKDG